MQSLFFSLMSLESDLEGVLRDVLLLLKKMQVSVPRINCDVGEGELGQWAAA